jgi:hypothetical protein
MGHENGGFRPDARPFALARLFLKAVIHFTFL